MLWRSTQRVSAVDSQGRTIWIVDAHREDGKRFVVRADEKLRARFWNWKWLFLVEGFVSKGAEPRLPVV